uniref:Secreted protein n=1 Tax=Heterorhabditis bacteriophora TaxID=37862 RepID=A0A1I7XMG2_HETBA
MSAVLRITAAVICWLAIQTNCWVSPQDSQTNENQPKMISISSRAFLPPRYKNLFGTDTSKVKDGSAFIPMTMTDFTGKVGQRRRQIFSWQPSSIGGDLDGTRFLV